MTEKNEQPQRMAGREFIAGKGWIVHEKEHATAAPLGHPAAPGVQMVAPPQLTLEMVEKFAADMGLVVVNAEEYQATLDRIGELEETLNQIDGEVEKAKDEEPEPAPKKSGRGKGKKKDEQPEVSAESIAACETLEALSALMHDCEDEELLALADARAEEIKAGGKE